MLGLGVDADLAAGRAQALVAHRVADRRAARRSRLLDRLGPQLDADVSRLHRIGDDAPLAEALAEGAQQLVILGRVDALEVGPRRVVTDHLVDLESADLLLAEAERKRRDLLAVDAGEAQLVKEGDVRRAVDGVEDHVRLRRHDLLDDRPHRARSQRDVGLTHHLRTQRFQACRATMALAACGKT